ncbi:hypothetical protein Trydic_g7248 [Trypoxylus dichotomus]
MRDDNVYGLNIPDAALIMNIALFDLWPLAPPPNEKERDAETGRERSEASLSQAVKSYFSARRHRLTGRLVAANPDLTAPSPDLPGLMWAIHYSALTSTRITTPLCFIRAYYGHRSLVGLMLSVAGACGEIELVELPINDVTDLGNILLVNIRASKNGINFIVKHSDKSEVY